MKEIKLYEQWLNEFTGPVGGEFPGSVGVDFSYLGVMEPGNIPTVPEPHVLENFTIDLLQKFNVSRPQPGNLTIENEIPTISNIQSGLSDEDRVYMQSANDKPIALHVEAAKKEGIELDEKWLKECWDVAAESAQILKDKWKVNRPFEVDSKIKGLVPTKSYSFPSANAAGTFFVAKKIGEKYPQLKESQMEVATKIANSRVQAGVHYPLDIEVGKALALGLL